MTSTISPLSASMALCDTVVLKSFLVQTWSVFVHEMLATSVSVCESTENILPGRSLGHDNPRLLMAVCVDHVKVAPCYVLSLLSASASLLSDWLDAPYPAHTHPVQLALRMCLNLFARLKSAFCTGTSASGTGTVKIMLVSNVLMTLRCCRRFF